MADIPLTHLSRPQLVHLLLRIVDLLSQPVQPATCVPSGTPLEPYDASLDPWNAPDVGQSTNAGVGVQRYVATPTPILASLILVPQPFILLCQGHLQDYLGLVPTPNKREL